MLWAFAVAALVALLAIAYAFRLRRVSLGGSFECGLRRVDAPRVSEGWARYARGSVVWFALASFRYRPSRRWSREELADLEVRGAVRSDRGNELLVIRLPGGEWELLMRRSAYAGLRSWLEAAPPRAGAGES